MTDAEKALAAAWEAEVSAPLAGLAARVEVLERLAGVVNGEAAVAGVATSAELGAVTAEGDDQKAP